MHELDKDTTLSKKTPMLLLLNLYDHEGTSDIRFRWQDYVETIYFSNRVQFRNTKLWVRLRKLNQYFEWHRSRRDFILADLKGLEKTIHSMWQLLPEMIYYTI